MRSLQVCRPVSLRSGDTDQPLRTELVNQVEQILLQYLWGDLVLFLHDLKHLLQDAVLVEEVPHPRAHLIEAEVDA